LRKFDNVIIIRYGEIFLKGKNIDFFENLLYSNIKYALNGVGSRVETLRSRYIVSGYAEEDEPKICAKLKNVFGIISFSIARKTANNIDVITKEVFALSKKNGKFRVNVRRADKTFPMHSQETAAELGFRLLNKYKRLKVDLHNPDFEINADIRDNGYTYIYSNKISGPGGMPVGSAGEGLLMLSGGIDSPVAGYMMAKRGLKLTAVHFFSYPYTSMDAKEKVKELAKILTNYCGSINLLIVPFTAIQEEINSKCDASFTITIMRRFMMRVCNAIAAKINAGAIVTGESLGQVASQTMQSMRVTEEVSALPVFRPLIGMDKDEIIAKAKAIGTFETSILPYDDCCTVFVPKYPQTRPDPSRTQYQERDIDIDKFVSDAVAGIERIYLKPYSTNEKEG